MSICKLCELTLNKFLASSSWSVEMKTNGHSVSSSLVESCTWKNLLKDETVHRTSRSFAFLMTGST